MLILTKPPHLLLPHPSPSVCVLSRAPGSCDIPVLEVPLTLAPQRADQVHHLTPGSARSQRTAPLVHENPVSGTRLALGWDSHPALRRPGERGKGPQQKLVCVVSFFCVFCLSVQELQLLKSALPLIKPCSLHPGLCVTFISPCNSAAGFEKHVIFLEKLEEGSNFNFFFFFQFERKLNKLQRFWLGLSANNWIVVLCCAVQCVLCMEPKGWDGSSFQSLNLIRAQAAGAEGHTAFCCGPAVNQDGTCTAPVLRGHEVGWFFFFKSRVSSF